MFVRQSQFSNSNADVQIFYGSALVSQGSSGGLFRGIVSWNKPPGVSHVYMMLIGRGGHGDGVGVSGGSGAVTVWYGSAQNIPDTLFLRIGGSRATPTTHTSVYLTPNDSDANYLLRAEGGTSSGAGAAMTANAFAASGFFKSVAGEAAGTPSSTTFLQGGTGGSSNTSNYGYSASQAGGGYFQLQPIIVGVGGAGSSTQTAGIGCGGAVNGYGGGGMVLIASW